MSTYVIGFHDGWMHHPVASVESGYPPNLADSDADWCVELTAGDVEYMDEEELTALEYIIDLAHDGRLSHATGKHEPYMDGEPNEIYADENVMRIWRERGRVTTDSIHSHRQD